MNSPPSRITSNFQFTTFEVMLTVAIELEVAGTVVWLSRHWIGGGGGGDCAAVVAVGGGVDTGGGI